MTGLQNSQKELADFYESQNHILTLTTILQVPLHKKEPILKRLPGTCEVVHKMNISWFLKNIEMAIRCWTHILKGVGHFIFT